MKQRTKGLWLVQICEYGIGFALAMSATRSTQPATLSVFAVAIIVNAAIFEGPLAAFRAHGVRSHRMTGYVIAVCALVIGAVTPLDITSRLTLVVVAMAQGFVSVRFGNGIRTTSTRPQ